MREIRVTNQFKRDLKRERKGLHRSSIESILESVLFSLVRDKKLAACYRDHILTGNYVGLRDCHLKPDLILIYDNSEPGVLCLVRLGSHAELGL